MKRPDYLRLLTKIARLYYEQELNQQQIAKRIGLSRQKVQRLLKHAKDEGIVRIGITPVRGDYSDLELVLANDFDIREVVIVETVACEEQSIISKELGAAAAEYLLRVVRSHDRIVISWGSALLGMVDALFHLPGTDAEDIAVIQGLGGLVDPNNEVHAAELTRRLAKLLHGKAVLLPAPGAAGSVEAKEVFYADPHVKAALTKAQSANLAFVSIGAPRQESILVQGGNIVRWEELAHLQKQGAVGDINLRYFNKYGQLIDSDLNKRVIGLSIEELRQTGHVVGVAGGRAKFKAIAGALAGNLIDVLVTDHITAQRLLELKEKTQKNQSKLKATV